MMGRKIFICPFKPKSRAGIESVELMTSKIAHHRNNKEIKQTNKQTNKQCATNNQGGHQQINKLGYPIKQ